MWRTPRCYSANVEPQPSVVFVGDRIQSRDTVFAKNIPNYFTVPEQIAEIFSRAGNIRRDFRGLRIKMYYYGRNGSFNGRARITFNTDKEAFLACHLLDQQRHGENVLDVKMALDKIHNQRNEPNVEKSDWTCRLCDKRGLTRVNYVWQKTCYNCQNDKTFCDTYDQPAIRQKPKRTAQMIAKVPLKKKQKERTKGEIKPDENPPLLNPFYGLKVEVKEDDDKEETPRPKVTTDSGVHSVSGDDSSDSSGESADTEDSANNDEENLFKDDVFEESVENRAGEGLPKQIRTSPSRPVSVKPEMDTADFVHNVHILSSSETDTSMDSDDQDHSPKVEAQNTQMKTEDEEASVSSEHFEHSNNAPDNELDYLDASRLNNELESEIEASLLNTFNKYDLLRANFPLNVKIEVSKAEKSDSLERLSLNLEKLNVKLSLDHSLGIQEADIQGEGQNVHMEDLTQENVSDEDVQITEAPQALPSELKQASGKKVLSKFFEGSTSSEESSDDDDNFDQPGSMFIPMHSYAENKDKTHGEDEKSRRKFTLDQDKAILDKVIAIIGPGQRLDYLELAAASTACKEVARRLGRTESSIQGRWKYSLRSWLLEYFQKKTKSWTGFTVKASIERRKAVADYFVKELRKRRRIKIDGLSAKIK